MLDFTRRLRAALTGDEGMSTAEYAVGTLAAVAFATTLYAVATSGSVEEALTGIIQRGLQGAGT
ncbi:DUF4244 domain-containing protein [Saccharopolyspora tripterygii]